MPVPVHPYIARPQRHCLARHNPQATQGGETQAHRRGQRPQPQKTFGPGKVGRPMARQRALTLVPGSVIMPPKLTFPVNPNRNLP
jgi:hypothetical protein